MTTITDAVSAMEQESKLKDETSINFRPSSNFKHMKKYFKSKFEEDMSSTSSESNDSVKKDVQATVQPPLPPNTPPSDWPQPIVLKKEVEDDEFQQIEQFVAREENVVNTKNVNTNKKKSTLCKDFFRKKCIRGTACNFSHEIIPEQMEYVYKFCIDFENRKCKRPACGYVHATTSEKEHFIRTGDLPEHVFHHLKKKKCELTVAVRPEIKPDVYTQPPQIHFSSAVSMAASSAAGGPLPASPLAAVVPPPVAALPVPAIATATALTSVTVLHDYGDMFQQPKSSSGPEIQAKELKSCNSCETNLLKYVEAKSIRQLALQNSQDLDKSIDDADRVNRRYQRILKMLLKSQSAPVKLPN